jgi:beta-N-acetylhexosaminidase
MNKSEILWRGIWGQDIADVAGPKAGGAVIFARNLDKDPDAGPEKLFNLIHALRQDWGTPCPIAVAIDQEGGRVSRLKAWVGETPPLRQIWLKGGAEACRTWGRIWGEGLSLLGISVNFAPVFDLFDGREGTGLGDRCASEDPNDVCEAAGAYLDGLESTGTRGCLKHFPGLGGTQVDSHHEMPSINDAAIIEKNVIPFLRLAGPERLVMVAHLQTPESNDLPASLHRGHVAENKWGIRAAWIPDDMEMGGCQAADWPTRTRLALEAGHIALLVCQSAEVVQQASDAVEAMDDSLLSPAIESYRSLRKTLKPMPKSFDAGAWKAWVSEVRWQSEEML